MQGASRQHGDRELRLRVGAVRAACMTRELPRPACAVGVWRSWPCIARPLGHRPAADGTKAFENAEFRYSVTLPAAAGTTRAPARSTPSARPISIRRRARGERRHRAGARGRRRAGARRRRQGARRAGPALRRGAIQGGAGGGGLRRGRPGPRQDRQRQAGSRRPRESCTRPTSPARRSSSWGSASVAPPCSS